jgi:hypothetical protein
MNILHDINIFSCTCSHELFGFSSKVEAQWPMAGQVVPASAEAPAFALAPLAKKKK